MPFSFIDVEESKSRVIAVVFLFILFFYFLTTYLLLAVLENSLGFPFSLAQKGSFLPPPMHALIAFIIALTIALFHWIISTDRLMEKMILAVGAQPIDEKDIYHQYLKNIVDEVSVATGGKPMEAMVIPSSGTNAFSLQDFSRRSIIGVTEGLLARLNRTQLEAVVAHEAGHIVCQDSLTATVIASLSEIYEEALSKIKGGLRGTRGRGAGPIILVYLVLIIMNFLSGLLRLFLSREREYRADAVSVRLTRNPLSLAEALKLISRHWRGAGQGGARVESVFILNPRYSELDEQEGLISDLFSTHPPVRKRVNVLLDMAHLDEKALDDSLKDFKRVSPVAVTEFKASDYSGPKRWFIFQDSKWIGPFLSEELRRMEGLAPDQWVRQAGRDQVMAAYEDQDFRKIFTKAAEKEGAPFCPHCKTPLEEVSYEGVPILKCAICTGVLIKEDSVSRILIRQDKVFSQEAERVFKAIVDSKGKFSLKDPDAKSAWVMDCPRCRQKMRRQFFVYSYPVEIDRCQSCNLVWLDKEELEILQYIYEHKEEFLF